MVHSAVGLLPPPPSACVAQPAIELAPSLKLTVPVGAIPVTVAVKVTGVPAAAMGCELTTIVVVATAPPPLTACVSGGLVDAWLPGSPL